MPAALKRFRAAARWTRLRCACIAAATLLAAGTSWTSAVAQGATKGALLFEEKGCYQCHGYAGQGTFAGVRIAPEPLPWQTFARIVRKPYGVMPAYSPRMLTDAELLEIYEHLSTLPAPAAENAIRSILD